MTKRLDMNSMDIKEKKNEPDLFYKESSWEELKEEWAKAQRGLA